MAREGAPVGPLACSPPTAARVTLLLRLLLLLCPIIRSLLRVAPPRGSRRRRAKRRELLLAKPRSHIGHSVPLRLPVRATAAPPEIRVRQVLLTVPPQRPRRAAAHPLMRTGLLLRLLRLWGRGVLLWSRRGACCAARRRRRLPSALSRCHARRSVAAAQDALPGALVLSLALLHALWRLRLRRSPQPQPRGLRSAAARATHHAHHARGLLLAAPRVARVRGAGQGHVLQPRGWTAAGWRLEQTHALARGGLAPHAVVEGHLSCKQALLGRAVG